MGLRRLDAAGRGRGGAALRRAGRGTDGRRPRAGPCSPPRSCRFSAARCCAPTSTCSRSRSSSRRSCSSRATGRGPASPCSALAVMTKVFPIVVAPVAIAWLVARGRRRDAWQGALALRGRDGGDRGRSRRGLAGRARSTRSGTTSTARSRSRARPPWCCSAWTRPARGTRRACRASGPTASSTGRPTRSRRCSCSPSSPSSPSCAREPPGWLAGGRAPASVRAELVLASLAACAGFALLRQGALAAVRDLGAPARRARVRLADVRACGCRGTRRGPDADRVPRALLRRRRPRAARDRHRRREEPGAGRGDRAQPARAARCALGRGAAREQPAERRPPSLPAR